METLVELLPDWGAGHAWLAYVYYQSDKTDAMEREIRTAVKLQEGDASTHYALGVIYAGLRQFDETETQLLAAIELEPDVVYFYRNLAYAYSATADLRWLAYTSRLVQSFARRFASPLFSESFLAGWSDTEQVVNRVECA